MTKRNNDGVITIPLSKILLFCLFCLFCFIAVRSCDEGKKNKQDFSKKDTSVAIIPKSASGGKINKMNFNDISKTLQQNPPNFAKNCDTVKWQKKEIIRYFSIDTVLQRKTASLVKHSNPKYGAALAINPKTGQVLAMVSYSDPEYPKIADNLCLSNKFPAASVFKTVAADAIFENTDIACSTQINYVGKNTTLYKSQFLPENFGEKSNSVSFAQAYAKSINPVFGWLIVHEVGYDNLSKSALKFGYNTKVPFEIPTDISVFPENINVGANDSIFLAELGSGFNKETTLTPLLGGLIAAAVSNNAVMMTPTIVDSVTDMSGKKLYSASPKKWKICSAPDISDSIKYIMRQTAIIGSAQSAFSVMDNFSKQKKIIYGGKTGTKDSEFGRNELFIGFTHDLESDVSIATSVCFVQKPMFMLRPSQVSADMMFEYIKKQENKQTMQRR